MQKMGVLSEIRHDFRRNKEQVKVAVNMAWPAVMEFFLLLLQE